MISKCKSCIHGPVCTVTLPEWAERLLKGYGYGTDGARSSQGPRGARCKCYQKRPPVVFVINWRKSGVKFKRVRMPV